MTADSIAYLPRKTLLSADSLTKGVLAITASVPDSRVDESFSTLINSDQFSYYSSAFRSAIARDGFAVGSGGNLEFFEVYEYNRYSQIPNFVTVDSMMHTYHLYFSALQKKTEKQYLSAVLGELGTKLLESSIAQYEKAKGSGYEQAALRNIAFFNVGARLMDDKVSVYPGVRDVVDAELALINEASGVEFSPLMREFDIMEDYSQYTVRGYYEGDPVLERYFRAMMWYGRISFAVKEDELTRSALLMTSAMSDPDILSLWESIYSITSFFAGASDDATYYEYQPVAMTAYDTQTDVDSIVRGGDDAFSSFARLASTISPPAINSVPMPDDNGKTDKRDENKGFRFMGQRFTLDGAIFQELMYSRIKERPDGKKRMLPNGLDIPAALGSDMALTTLKSTGEADYPGYDERMNALRKGISDNEDTLWTGSLYAGWLNTLRPLLNTKGEGYPYFMQTDAWALRNVESFLGSWSELKHDTVLYGKQPIAEMGGGPEEPRDERGYVEPEPEVYARLSLLTQDTLNGLKSLSMLSPEDEESLSRLSELSSRLQVISEKELRNETLTDEEYELILTYGGTIEHFWHDAVSENDDEYIQSSEYPAALITDVATDPNGEVLQVGTGRVCNIYAVVPVDGTLRIAVGGVYSYYEFRHPIGDRLTDSKWRVMLGISPDEYGNYNYETDAQPSQPAWAASYRVDLYDR